MPAIIFLSLFSIPAIIVPDICAIPVILSWYLSKTGTYYFFLCAKFFLCANSFHLPGTCVVLTVIFGE